MSLSRRYLNANTSAITLDFDLLARELQESCPAIVFAYILGSAKDVTLPARSDLDIAVYTNGKPTMETLSSINDIIERLYKNVTADIGFLNGNEPVYCFEALKGRLLFCRDHELWVSFFVRTCKAYELQMYHYEKYVRLIRSNIG